MWGVHSRKEKTKKKKKNYLWIVLTQHYTQTKWTLCSVHADVSDMYRPQEVHTGQGLKVGLYTPTILGGNSYISWFYDRGAINDPAHAGSSKRVSHHSANEVRNGLRRGINTQQKFNATWRLPNLK